MFELRIQEPKVANNPTVAVRWCLGRQESNWLLEKKIEQPYILIVVCYMDHNHDVYLEPLDKLMTYITFRSSGRHQVLARIVWPQISAADEKRGGLARSFALTNWKDHVHGLDWIHHVKFNHDQKVWRFWEHGDFGKSSPFTESPECLSTIEVAKEYFAPAPSGWLWNWVNLWYRTRPRDPCQFRKRMILAFALQPLVECLLVIIKELCWLITLLFGWVIFGWRGMHPKVLFAPWRHGFLDVYGRKQGSWWLEESCGLEKSRFVFLLHPLVLSAEGYALHSLSRYLGLGYFQTVIWLAQKTAMILWFVIGYLPVQVAFAALAVGWLTAYLLRKRLHKAVDENSPGYQERMRHLWEQQEERRRRHEAEMVQYYNLLYKSAACAVVPKSPSLESLAQEKRTFHLRFLDLKAKVCRPFAR